MFAKVKVGFKMVMASALLAALASTGCSDDKSPEKDSSAAPTAQPQQPAAQQPVARQPPPAQPLQQQPVAAQPVPAAVQPAAAPAPAADPLAGAFFLPIPQTRLKVPVASGWHKLEGGGLYTMVASPKDQALFLFTTVSTRGELAGRKQQIQRLAKITNLRQTGSQNGTVGPNQLSAQIETYDATFHGTPGDLEILYVSQQPRSRHLAVVYVVSEKNVDPAIQQQGLAMLKNIGFN